MGQDHLQDRGGIGWKAAHEVQLSYSSPTLGLLGSYALEGVSNTRLTASTSTTTPAMVNISCGLKCAAGGIERLAMWYVAAAPAEQWL